MIPYPVVTAWRKHVGWVQDEQVEQDLIISRALVELFNNSYIKERVAFRGGTALHKVIFPKALRYSEDIDLNRLEEGNVKPLLVEIRKALKDSLGTKRRVVQTNNSVKLFYNYQDVAGGARNLKIEINTRETLPQKPLELIPFTVDSDFFSGQTELRVFNREEMIGTKIRALYQRNKGRDLFDLYLASNLSLDWAQVINSFKQLNLGIPQKVYKKNLDLKMQDNEFLEDIKPLLPSNVSYNPKDAYQWFLKEILPKL